MSVLVVVHTCADFVQVACCVLNAADSSDQSEGSTDPQDPGATMWNRLIHMI